MKITLQDIIDQVAEQTEATKKLSEDFLREFFNIIEEALAEEDTVKIKGLGTFKLLLVEERKSVNVQTGEEITIPQHNKVSFAPEKELKAAINKPYSHLETYVLSQDASADDLPNLPENEDENEEEESEISVIIEEKEEFQSIVIPVQEENENEPSVIIYEEETQSEIIVPVQEEEKEGNEDNVAINNYHYYTTAREEDAAAEEEVVEEKKEEKKKRGCIGWILILLLLLGLAAFLIWYLGYFKQIESFVKEKIKTEKVEVAPEAEIDEDEMMDDYYSSSDGRVMDDMVDYTIYDPNDTTTPNPNRAPEFEGEYLFDKKFDFRLVDYMQAHYPKMKLVTFGAPQQIELREGSRLTLMALKHYGHKQFWVYIYLYNTDIVDNPDDIPAGTILRVPRLDNSLANPKNPACIRAAWSVQTYLLKMYERK